MKRLFFTVTFLFVFVFHSYAQLNWDNTLFSISFLQKTDSKERFESRNFLDNISFGLEVYRNVKDDITDYDISHIIFGITSEDALVDFRKDGFAPVEDSILVSDIQLFTRVYNNKGVFIGLLVPVERYDSKVNARMVIGYSYYIMKNTILDISYRFLLEANKDGFRKGMLTLGLSTRIKNLKL